MICIGCNKDFDDSFTYCPHCGRRRSQAGGGKEPYEDSSALESARPSRTAETGEGDEGGKTGSQTIGWVPVVAIAVAVIAVIGWVMAGVFLKTGPTSDEADTERLAEQLIDNITDKNCDAVFDQLSTDENSLLGILVSESLQSGPKEILTLDSDTDLKENRVTRDFIESYFTSRRKDLTKGNVKSLDSRKLEEGEYYVVAVYSFGRETAYPLMEVKTGDGWKIDMSALLVRDDKGAASQYVIDSVEALLSDPSRENARKAIDILKASEGLEAKYDLWLRPESTSLLDAEEISGVTQGKRLTDRFEGLMIKAEEVEKRSTGKSDEADVEPSPEATPRPPLTGEGTMVTAPFELEQGLVVFHMEYQGSDEFSAILMSPDGVTMKRLTDSTGPLTGSQAVGVSGGQYTIQVQASGGWTIGIDESVPTEVSYPPQTWSGAGPFATPFFQTGGGPLLVRMEYQGWGPFVVTVMEIGGNSVALLANEWGSFEGSTVVSLRSEVTYLLNVEAEGDWSITVE
jgi:hypothetical protein